jgi:hypothetical protein
MGYLDGQLESRCETSGADGRRTVRINEIDDDVLLPLIQLHLV